MLFKELILIKIFSLSFALVFGQNEDNLQFAIFGEPCQCVELSKCTNKTLATAPENEDCRKQQFNTICCDPSDIIQQQTNSAANNCVDNNGNCVASTVGINNNNAKKCGQFYKKAFIERAGFDEEEEVEDGEFPWMIAVFDKSTGRLQCGASLIHPKAVITAAHCFKRNKENYLFRAALWNISADDELYEKQETEAQTIVIHPNFVQRNVFNDIAFVVLKKEFSLNRAVSLTCLPPPNQFYDDTNCFGTGWGKKPFVTGEEYHDTLKKLQLPVVGHRQCQTLLRNTDLGRKYLLHKSFLCAGGQRGRDMCLHDGGGPLVCLIPGQRDVYHQVGIVSWGLGCGLENVPGVYVDVSYFRNWIDAEMTKYNLDKSVYQF